jgi:hypothetical protein
LQIRHGRDVVPCDGALIRPCQDGVAGQFAAVVADHHLRLAVLDCQPVLCAPPGCRRAKYRPPAPDTRGCTCRPRSGFGSEAVRELIRHEVERLAVVRRHRHDHGTLVQSPACGRHGDTPQASLPGGAGTPEQLLVVDQVDLSNEGWTDSIILEEVQWATALPSQPLMDWALVCMIPQFPRFSQNKPNPVFR